MNKKLWLAGGVLAVVGAVLWSRPAAASGGEVDDGDDATDDPEAAGGAAAAGSPLAPYTERRVLLKDYATLTRADPRLSMIANQPGKLLHWAAVDGWQQLHAALEEAGFERVRIASAWRPPAFATKEAYEAAMIKKYGSVEEGRKWKAYASAHQTGLAIDLGSHGLEPKRATIPKQLDSKIFKWLRDNAYRYGWAPYKREPWHWEFPITRAQFDRSR